MILQDRKWRLKYTPDHGDLVRSLYVPALSCAARYDRLTGFFAASALALAARGVEHMVANGGRMRMIVGCTLEQPEIDAIEHGEGLKNEVERRLLAVPLTPTDLEMGKALELLAWMVARGHLDIRVAVPCDAAKKPLPAEGLFHEKAGIVEDKAGDRIAFNGSLNETAAGWTRNWESLNVFTSWRDPDRVREEDENFARIWSNQAKHVITLDVLSAIRDDLFRFLPQTDKPVRLKQLEVPEPQEVDLLNLKQQAPPTSDLRHDVWSFIGQAPRMPNGGNRVGEVTSAVTPWPHQLRAFHRLYNRWPPKLLIADEVGLGKTIQAGLLLRQAWLAGRAKRILILAPKNVCKQWQIELREKFNLNWPIYDGGKLSWYPSPGLNGLHERPVSRDTWHHEPTVIVSSHLARRADRQKDLLDAAEPYDLVILDEAHHARRRAAGSLSENRSNALLALMRRLKERTQGLVLLTATPMQVHPVEVFDLLNLLGMPPEWGEEAFLRFFADISHVSPSHEAMDWLAAMFQAVEASYGEVAPEEVQRFDSGLSGLRAKRILSALRDKASTPRRTLETSDRRTALRIMQVNTPVNRLISRNTRELLRSYYKAGKITTPIADRKVRDAFIALSSAERAVYEAVEHYIATTYNQANEKERSAIGFVMTIYRRRLASSFFALAQTLEGRLRTIAGQKVAGDQAALEEALDEDDGDDPDKAADLNEQALALEEQSDISGLLATIRNLPRDTKIEALGREITKLRSAGYGQVMVFTQFTDTMDCLRGQLVREPNLKIMCFSGRGGEVASHAGTWQRITRDEVKRRFREGQADVLLCTDAAAEGLNFQFCGALINYDMPWNPMRVEQRIGRIDRLGQRHSNIQIVNLHYADTVETDVYMALRSRIGLFEKVVGKLQPILSRMPALIAARVLDGRAQTTAGRRDAANEIEVEAERVGSDGGFDIDVVTNVDIYEGERGEPPLTMNDLDMVIRSSDLVPPGLEASVLGAREYRFIQPGFVRAIRVTTDPAYYEQHADTVEFWSPGSPTFPRAGDEIEPAGIKVTSLRTLLER